MRSPGEASPPCRCAMLRSHGSGHQGVGLGSMALCCLFEPKGEKGVWSWGLVA